MDNLSQNNFDDLFREGSEKVEFEYREDAWAALDERLEEKERKRRLLWILLGLASSTVIIGLMFYYFNNSQSRAFESTPIQENVVITERQKEVVPETTATKLVSPTSEVNTNTSQIVDKNIAANTIAKSTAPQVTNTDFIQNTPPTNAQTSEQKNYNVPILTEEKEETVLFQENLEEGKNYQVAPSIDNPIVPHNIKKIKLLAGTALQNIKNEKEVSVDQFSTITKLLKGPKSQFSFGVFGSLDFNALSLNKDKIEQGYRLGLRTDYNFAKRFSLGIGVAFSRKTYTAQGFRYNAKPGFWSDGIAPIEVQANTNLIEIPLELRFYAKGHSQDGFFVGAGINSYHLTLEKYNFHYEEILANTINNWEERGTNTNLFSLATFTVGYQKTVNKNLAFQIAPYVNLPLTGIGQGSVNLQSVGLNVAVNWRK